MGEGAHVNPVNGTRHDWTAGVVVVIDPDGKDIDIERFGEFGIYGKQNYALFDKYADVNDLAAMSKDQFNKLTAQRPSPQSPCFLLSWTLTQSSFQATTCRLGADSILDLAAQANPSLLVDLTP